MTESAGPPVVHPGRVLLERVMQPLGISRNQLARDIDVPVGRISDITNGKRGVTADTALRLARYFGIPAQLWLQLQAEYDLQAIRSTTWRKIEPRVRILEIGRHKTVAASNPAADRLKTETGLVETAIGADALAPELDPTGEGLAIPPMPRDER